MRTTFSWAYGDIPLTGSYGNHDEAVPVILLHFLPFVNVTWEISGFLKSDSLCGFIIDYGNIL